MRTASHWQTVSRSTGGSSSPGSAFGTAQDEGLDQLIEELPGRANAGPIQCGPERMRAAGIGTERGGRPDAEMSLERVQDPPIRGRISDG